MAKTVGDVLAFSAEVRDAAGVLANAGTMTLTVTKPDGTAEAGSPFTVTSSPTGIYDKDITSAQAGRYVGYWLATGANSGAHTQVFHVRSGAETWLVSLDEVKDHLGKSLTVTTDDQELERKIGTATGVVEYFCGPVVRRTYTRTVTGGSDTLVLPHNQLVSVTSITPILTSAPAVTLADLDTADPDGLVRHKSGLPISWGPLRAVYICARTDIPDELIEAALIIIAHLWETQRGSTTSRPQIGGEETFLPQFGFAIPNRAMDLLKLHPAPAGVA